MVTMGGMMREPERKPARTLAAGVTEAMRAEIAEIYAGTQDERSLAAAHRAAPRLMQDVLFDMAVFRRQAKMLAELRLSPYVALLRDAENPALSLPTPIVVEERQDLSRAYPEAVEVLATGGLDVRPAEPDDAENAFISRVAEFNAVAASRTTTNIASGGGGDTVVTTRRHGDPVLCCKGYFASTATAVGTSQVVNIKSLVGRHSFGIVDAGLKRFDGVVWNCPDVNVSVHLP